MDEYEADERTVRAALRGPHRHGKRPKLHTEDIFAAISIAMQAERIPTLHHFINRRPEHEIVRVRPCTTARFLADHVKGNSRRSKIERLRREFRKHEKLYRETARQCAYILSVSFNWGYPSPLLNAEILSTNERISALLSAYPLAAVHIEQGVLPWISVFREELRAKIRQLDNEITALKERELEIIGPEKRSSESSISGINALPNHP
jgi:hypothetical protein